MRGKRTGWGGEGGSVLLEGILVLPIYLALLGAMFIVGDLERARSTLPAAERSLTWLAADRFTGHAQGSMLRMLAAFVDAETAPVTTYRVSELKEGDSRAGNTWLDAFMGYAVMDAKVPVWMRLANLHSGRASPGAGGAGEEEWPFAESYVLPAKENGAANRQYRSFVVRRLPESTDPNYLRREEGKWLADNVWINVTRNEPWVTGGGNRGLHEMPKGQVRAKAWEDYRRVLVAYGE